MLKVKKRVLLIIAGLVWLVAGFNVANIGIILYPEYLSVLNIILSLVIFLLFGKMFYSMTQKHTRRISGYEEEKHLIFRFFDLKSYIIIACMMTMGILVRRFSLAPEVFIAVFYTGLGVALTLAGVVFIIEFIRYPKLNPDD